MHFYEIIVFILNENTFMSRKVLKSQFEVIGSIE